MKFHVRSTATRLVTTLLAFCIHLVPGLSADARVQPDSHPNHYVVLIDASFGMVQSSEKSSAYANLIRNTLPALLYRQGMGTLPKLEPSLDYLTIMNFGIVGEEYSADLAYKHLKEYRFTRDFIHRPLVRGRQIGADRFASFVPQTYFQYTFLSLARSLALAALEGSSGPANRTFLIVVTDGEPNGNVVSRSPRAELDILNSWGDPDDISNATKRITKIEDNYALTDGNGQQGFAFQGKFSVSKDAMLFLEAHEVVPKAWLRWQNLAAQVGPPVLGVRATVRGEGETDRAQFEGTLSNAAIAWVNQLAPQSVDWRWVANEESKEAPCQNGRFLPLTARLLTPAPCTPGSYTLNTTARVVHGDPLLGMRTAQVTLSQVVSGPLRASCSTSFYLIAGAGVLLAVVAAWLVAERFFRNDLRVCLPLLVTEIPLARHRGGLANCGSIPRPGSLAFSLLLPAGWRQRLFYSGAVLSIHSPDNMLTWSGDQGHELRLPAKRGDAIIREAFAFWQSVPGEASEVQIRLEYGWRSGAVTLQFASGKT